MKNLSPKWLLAVFFIGCSTSYCQVNYANRFITAQQENEPVVYINLLLRVPEGPVLMDGVAEVYAPQYSRRVDDYDATKLSNFTENIALMRDGYKLAIETRPFPAYTDTMYLRLWQMKRQDYTLQTSPQYTPGAVKAAYLIDNYLHKKIALQLDTLTDYDFTVNPDTASYYNRFMIVFGVLRNGDKPGVVNNLPVATSNGSLVVFPNPVVNKQAVLQFNNMEKGVYRLEFFKQANKILESSVDYHGGKAVFEFFCGAGCKPGLYQLIIINNSTGARKNLSLIIS